MKLRDLFSGSPVVNPTLREVAAREEQIEDDGRDETADRMQALLPGDDDSNHPLRHEPVEYLFVAPSELLRQLRSGTLTPEEERKVRRALLYQDPESLNRRR